MKNIFFILIFITNLTFGQVVKLTEPEIEKYTKFVDKLRTENKLVKVVYPEMSSCGGGLYGYYFNKQLVLIEATYQAELGFSSQKYYIDQNKFLKIIYREHHAEWDKYDQKYPSDLFEFNPSKMTYADTVYSIVFAKLTAFRKSSNNKIVSSKIDQVLIDRLINCGTQMKLELIKVINQIDSLKFVKEMPYICEVGTCGDNLYWDAVSFGRINIGLLIEKLDDTTSTPANVVLFGGNYTVADIAFTALNEIIHNIPTFELLGVPFDKDGCGYCFYWQYLNKDFHNRQKFKESVKKWYYTNKNKLVWIESNNFSTCDCKGQHPNNGHYELKSKK